MVFKPEELPQDAPPVVFPAVDASSTDEGARQSPWRPLFRHECTFNPDIFIDVMINQIKNPNINSSWLFRADILYDSLAGEDSSTGTVVVDPVSGGVIERANIPSFLGLELRRSIVRRLIPRNTMRDNPLDQTCLIYQSPSSIVDNINNHDDDEEPPEQESLIVYLPHVSSPEEMPFYHPVVQGIAFLHKWRPASEPNGGSISVSYLFFNSNGNDKDQGKQPPPPTKVIRTAMHLLEAIYKHGQGRVDGYEKRVHHDLLVPQARLQNTYTRLKQTHARSLIDSWAETTDPGKHVFEDLCIAAFLIELWRDMYQGYSGEDEQDLEPSKRKFPGFVDIGCGNGLLVYILNKEGYKGWGFDARARKSWASYTLQMKITTPAGEEVVQDSLQQLVLLPPPAGHPSKSAPPLSPEEAKLIHDGYFPANTFIISNHADELTPWTPILATMSNCPFIMIPCCSHDLSGKKFRAPPPKDKSKADSAYSSLVAWVSQIAEDCGWVPEQEMLRIPSTRNTAVVGRSRSCDLSAVQIREIVARYGGTEGYLETVIKLARSGGKTLRDKEH
ncbi:putative AdoMet-dependent methyltransferase domain containing protein [Naviculisporaceae sp. PSN 640]